MTSWRFATLPLALVACLVASGSIASAGPITFYSTSANTDAVFAGTGGLRSGSGTITVGGVTGPVSQSYLWWHGPTNSTNPAVNANGQVNGNAIAGTNVGVGFDNFWMYQNSQAYRADTTAIINGNGAYEVNKLLASTNGAATAVFFDDGNAANNRDIAIFNGNDSNFEYFGPPGPNDPAGWNFTLTNINYSGGQVFLRMFVSDGQVFDPIDDGTLRVNGIGIATGGIFNGDTLPGPGVGNGNLFDIRSFDITALLTPGVNNLNVTLDPGFDDALSGVVAFVDLPSGALAPVPEPASVVMLGLGAGLLGVRFRRKRILHD